MTEEDNEFKESEDFLEWAGREQKKTDFYWKKFLDAIEDPIFIMSANGRVLLCNRALETFLNKGAEDIISRRCFHLVHHTETFIKGCPFVKSRNTGKRESYLLNMSDKWYRISIDPIYDNNGKFAGAVHIIYDVDEMLKNNAERALLGRIIEKTEDAIISTDINGIITGWNSGAEKMFGLKQADVMKTAFPELAEDPSKVDMKGIIEVFTESRVPDRVDARFRAGNGEILEVSLGISPVYDERDVLNGAAFILTNHTEQRKAEKNLLSFMAEAVLRLEKPLEMIKTNVEDILELYDKGDINKEELYDLLTIQVSNARKVLENISELKKAAAGTGDFVPEVMKDFLRQ